ncbi:hypothetical protein [Streptomyces tendae]|uniref:hypothetical protein n=1 Tax=Streptomyces tendae TaxID=1932 RepID=UPI003661F2CB
MADYVKKPPQGNDQSFEEQAAQAWDRADELGVTITEIAGVKLPIDEDEIPR